MCWKSAHLPPAGGAQDLLQQVRGDLAAQEGRQLLVQLALVDLGLRHPGVVAQSTASHRQANPARISTACIDKRGGAANAWQHSPRGRVVAHDIRAEVARKLQQPSTMCGRQLVRPLTP